MLGLYGSPREDGNTSILLDAFLEGCAAAGARTQRIGLAGLRVEGCRGCNACAETGRCVIEDAMEGLYQALDRCDRIVLAAPIYFYSVPAQVKAVIDRAQAFWSRKYLREGAASKAVEGGARRRGFFIAVGATRGKRLFEGVLLTVRYFFDAMDVDYGGHLVYKGVDEKGAIREHPTAIGECREAGYGFAAR